ncbi:MAG: BfmA/BtgA family mobilization protein [Mucilaginibacter sp.]|uniref:BfmA/BtgA family mobilization protein n=1 Tax=Mucilaginibacter sp. TaxID=1882438 RepID=UPI0031B15C23
MMTVNENNKTIRFSEKTDNKLQIIANKCGLSKLDLFTFMVDYFYKTKKDPRDLNDDLLKNAINRKTDNIVAFIKTQEQDLLIPMKKDGERLNASQRQIVEHFNKHIIAHNEQQKKSYDGQVGVINRMAELLNRLDSAQLDKNKLKKRFSGILDHYITEREKMNMLSKQVDKDELIRFIREQVNNL